MASHFADGKPTNFGISYEAMLDTQWSSMVQSCWPHPDNLPASDETRHELRRLVMKKVTFWKWPPSGKET